MNSKSDQEVIERFTDAETLGVSGITRTDEGQSRARPAKDLRVVHAICFAVVLFVSVMLLHLALVSFGFGWAAWFWAIVLTFGAEYWTVFLLRAFAHERLLIAVAVASLAAGLKGLIATWLAHGETVGTFLIQAFTSCMRRPFSTAQCAPVPFHSDAVWELRVFLALLALSAELGVGLTAHWVDKQYREEMDVLIAQDTTGTARTIGPSA